MLMRLSTAGGGSVIRTWRRRSLHHGAGQDEGGGYRKSIRLAIAKPRDSCRPSVRTPEALRHEKSRRTRSAREGGGRGLENGRSSPRCSLSPAPRAEANRSMAKSMALARPLASAAPPRGRLGTLNPLLRRVWS